MIDRVLVTRDPSVDCRVTVKRRIEAVSGRHIRCCTANLYRHVRTMFGIPDVGIMADEAVVLPVLFPRRDDIEDVRSCSCGIAVERDPHGSVLIVRRSWDEILSRTVTCHQKKHGEKDQYDRFADCRLARIDTSDDSAADVMPDAEDSSGNSG